MNNQSMPIHTPNDIPNKNTLNNFLPVRAKGNDFSWRMVIGLVLRGVTKKKIENYSYSDFINDCQNQFIEKLGEEKFWDIIKKMYFDNENKIFEVSPEFSIFQAQKGAFKTSEERVAKLFTNMLGDLKIEGFKSQLTFIERDILSTFNKRLVEDEYFSSKEKPYLPFLAAAFQKDIRFLSERPNYLLTEIKHFLSLYAFIYCAQLSLSIDNWATGEPPEPKPLYFIIDTEKASSERSHIKQHGYKLFNESANKLFPMLSMLENLQVNSNIKLPLWEIYSNINDSTLQSEISKSLKQFADNFRTSRELDTLLSGSNKPKDLLKDILKLAQDQFDSLNSTRSDVNKKYVAAIETQFAKHFVQSRGRAGRVLVLSQDYLLLLTNLAIGEQQKMQFHELLKEFRVRGIFVDKQTELALIEFYERIGNVERLSDSGDAVYVRKTV